MENIFVEFLPPWVETGLQPAFYDKESGTVLQQTARMYAKVNELVATVNNQNTTIEDYITKFNELHDYVYDYFDNLDVQEEINNKLDQMLLDGNLTEIISEYVDTYMDETINPLVDNQNNRIQVIEDKVNAVSTFAPIPVSSTSAMTNTSKTYLLTTDGKWYYYNGASWVAGGVYQSVSVNDNSIYLRNLSNNLASNIYHLQNDVSLLGSSRSNNNATENPNTTSPFFIKAGTTINFSSDFVANYHWRLLRIYNDGLRLGSTIKAYSTDTSYTFTNDETCFIQWEPIDGNWDTQDYEVDYKHYLDSNDVTNIKYYYPSIEYNTLLGVDVNAIKQSIWCTCLAMGNFIQNWYRLGTSRPYKTNADIVISTNSLLDFGVVTWDLSNGIENRSQLTDSGWLNDTTYVIPANTYFTLGFKLHDGSSFANNYTETIKNEIFLRSFSTLNDARAYAEEYSSGIGEFNYTGENLDLQFKHGYNRTDVMNMSPVATSSQAFDIYNNQYLVQLYAENTTIQIIDFESKTQLGVISNVGFDHGDTCQFSNTFYDPSDLLPLLYVTSDTTPAICHIVRIRDLNTATVIKSYVLDSEAGYYAGQCYDFENNLMYAFGYKQNEFHTNTGGTNNVIVSVYDMSKETFIGGIKYSIELLDRWEIPFIYTMQGQKFLNGKCYLVSSYLASEQHTYIYVYDPIRRQMTTIFKDMPWDIATYETEDIAFIKGDNKYEMIAGTRVKYMKLTFLD